MGEHNGPVILRKRPVTDLDLREGYALPEDATRDDLEMCARWLRHHGVEVPYVDDHGLLAVSHYRDEEDGRLTGERYYEFVHPPTVLLVAPDGEVRNHGLLRDYDLDTPEEQR